ncbi:MAG TPA: toll/interleukin-1 receptor domain-containing protein [Nocardioides sp.]|uniref:toll/interleukin-1 receptor domain-containing protein n=1 Tax=Nocardioides sp. TaxID=35761 RepID=UPI002E3027BE|nr:toll/interleukin-1 receptor domain-containing protein [Nocardioides sp.]HEX5088934.1 toll/interleukin-1 receptor domain-containing protein [Nocardioides sp.]
MKIFISYARLNMTTAEALVRDLHSLGHQAFYDQDLTGGQRWWDTLLDQIQAADVFIPVLSDEYRDSQACRVEAEWADALHIPFVPVFTESQLPGMYDPIIAEANWVAYDPDGRDALADLARGVGSTTKRTLPDPLPPRPAIPLSYLVMMEREIRGEAELGRQRQLSIVSDLRSKLGTRESSGARELLQALRERPDVTFEVATTVDALLAAADPEPEPARAATAPPVAAKDPPVRRSGWAPPAPPATDQAASTAARPAAATEGSMLARSLAAAGALAAFLSVSIVPWVSLNSDSRTWYGFYIVMTFPESMTVDVAGWVTGFVFCAALAAILLVLVASLSRALSLGPRIAAVVGALLVTVLGFAATLSFTDNDEDLHMSVGPWLLVVGAVLMGVVLLKPSIGGGRASASTGQ